MATETWPADLPQELQRSGYRNSSEADTARP